MSSYFRTIQVGRVAATIISEGTGTWAMDLALDLPASEWRPFVETDGRDRMPIGINLVLLTLPDSDGGSTHVLIDAGCGEPTPQNLAMEAALEVARTPGIDGALAELGLSPGSIDLVAFTHAHGDHLAGAVVEREGRFQPRFPRARYLLGAPDVRDRMARGMWGDLANRWLDALAGANRLDLIEGSQSVAPGVDYLPAPGESPGHGLYRVESEGEVLYVLGDLFHHPAEVTHLDWAPVRRDRARLRESRQMLIDRALAENALLLATHLPFPGLGRLRRNGDTTTWEVAV
jgi:glyoxylase-like metal-dependent hydrolase (beta-lactamase superfamily II)